MNILVKTISILLNKLDSNKLERVDHINITFHGIMRVVIFSKKQCSNWILLKDSPTNVKYTITFNLYMIEATFKLKLSFHKGQDPKVLYLTHNLEKNLVPKPPYNYPYRSSLFPLSLQNTKNGIHFSTSSS